MRYKFYLDRRTLFKARQSQLDAYKVRKRLLFKRLRFGTIGMCILIMFLVWLQDALPRYNKKFWSRGKFVHPFTEENRF